MRILISGPWLAPRISGQTGIYWCAAWFAMLAVAAFLASVLETGMLAVTFMAVAGGLHAYAALGLLRGLKPAWHVAAFLAFIAIVTRLLATACAPGEIAEGDRQLHEAAIDIVVLAISVTVFSFLRKRPIRRLYGVPESYRDAGEGK